MALEPQGLLMLLSNFWRMLGLENVENENALFSPSTRPRKT